jgi:hypothetical protein
MLKRILFTLSALSCFTFAGEQTGTVKDVRVRATDGLHWFYVEGVETNKPECSSEAGRWMIKDENSTAGKSQMSILLTAFASGAQVKVYGTGTCDRWSSGEDVNSIHIVK